MYYIIMYGSVLLGIVALLIMGIGMVITSADKVKPGQDRNVPIKRMCKQGKVYIAICVILITLIAFVVAMIGINYIPGIGY